MASSQTLSDPERRCVARWAAACAHRVVGLYEADAESVRLIADALARTQAYAAGASSAREEIALRMVAVKAAGSATTPAGAAAARSVAQASAVAHMGAHALGAAAYATKAISLAHPGDPDAVTAEITWQLEQLSDTERDVLGRLPALGADASGPLGPGLLTQGILGTTIRSLQAGLG